MSQPNHPVDDNDLLASAIPIEMDEEEVEIVPEPTDDGAAVSAEGRQKIRRFEAPRQTHRWSRKPNVTGNGAVHCKTFVSKMRQEALDHLDEQINEWLDAHQDVEVKFVTTAVGPMVGKLTEPALVVNLWV